MNLNQIFRAASWLLLAAPLLSGLPSEALAGETSGSVAVAEGSKLEGESPGTGAIPTAEEDGLPPGMSRVLLRLDGNLDFCVRWNEIDIDPKVIKPREKRAGPLITSFAYKYQISASRRGTGQVTKLLESPVHQTAYRVPRSRPKHPPGPRLATPKDLERQKNSWNREKQTKWMSDNACTALKPQYEFALAPGQYDFYLGFDLLIHTGQWVPLISDYVSRVKVEEDQETIIHGKVDYTEGIRTVMLEGAETSSPSDDG